MNKKKYEQTLWMLALLGFVMNIAVTVAVYCTFLFAFLSVDYRIMLDINWRGELWFEFFAIPLVLIWGIWSLWYWLIRQNEVCVVAPSRKEMHGKPHGSL